MPHLCGGRKAHGGPLASLIAVGIALSGAPALPAQAAHQLPSRALILGVPFISWTEAASLDYADKNIVNPSLPASEGMVLKYWGRDLTSLRRSDQTLPEWAQHGGEGGSLDSLRVDVARGIPVIVCLAMTPIAHNPGPGAAAMMAMRDSVTREALERGGGSSGVLGAMVALDTLHRWGQVIGVESMRESVLMACRVVIGYDDVRRVVTLHDPSFGPAWEVSYADFDAMWGFWNRFYLAMYPDNFARMLVGRLRAPPYAARTTNQHAAEDFVYGYALASVGRGSEAEARLRTALEIPGLETGYRHLILVELARLAEARHDTANAVAAYRQAGDLLPQDPLPWLFLGKLTRADTLLSRAAALCADTAAQLAAWRALPHDSFMMGRCEALPAAQSAGQLAAGEIGFEPPGPGWARQEGPGVSLVRVEVPGSRTQAISVWPVDVPDALRGLPEHRQIVEYFEMERRNPRDVPWSGFVEGTRDIAHRRYATLTAQISLESEPQRPVTGDVLFILIFPDDFATRQRFYVVMWMDYHPARERGAGPKALDAFVGSLRVGKT